MTYKEAEKYIFENWDIVSPRLLEAVPPYMVLGCFIAPEGSTIGRLISI